MTPAEKARVAWIKWRAINISILGGIAVFIVIMVLVSPKHERPPAKDIGEKREAYLMVQQFMEDQLIAPATADYPSIYDPNVLVSTLNNKDFFVRGYVDAQNAFGAQIRKHYECSLTYIGNNKWRLIDLVFPD